MKSDQFTRMIYQRIVCKESARQGDPTGDSNFITEQSNGFLVKAQEYKRRN